MTFCQGIEARLPPRCTEDLAKLGHDVPQPSCGTLRQPFGDACAVSRLPAYRLACLVRSARPRLRLAIVEAIEETGNVLLRFALAAPVAQAH